MRERLKKESWQQLLTLVGTDSFSEQAWGDLLVHYQLSWDRIFYIKFGKTASIGAVAAAGPNPVIMRPDFIAPGRDVSSSNGKRRKSMAPPSTPSPIRRRNSLATPLSPTKARYSRRDSLCCTPQRRNSVAAHAFDTISLRTPIKRRDSVISANNPIASNVFIPITPISPISPIKRRDSVVRNRWESGTPLPPGTPRRRDSVSASAKSKSSKPLQKLTGVEKHVTGSDDELDDEQSLADWKAFCSQRRALKTKPSASESLDNGLPPQKLAKDFKFDPPVKRKRGRPSREEVAKRLEQEQALKTMNPSSDPLKETPKLADQKPDKKVKTSLQQQNQREASGAQQKKPPRQEQQTPQMPKSNKQQPPAAKPRCPVSDRGGADFAELSNVSVQISNGVSPAHMPTMAINFKCRSKAPPGDSEKEEGELEEGELEEEDEDLTAHQTKRRRRRSICRNILGPLSSDEDEGLISNQSDFMLNDLQAEEMLINDAMELTSPVGGGEGDKDGLDIDLDLDFHVRDENVANQMALIGTHEEMSINRCLESFGTKTTNEIDQCLENFRHKAPSEIDECVETAASENPPELTHTSEFFQALSSQPPVNVDKSNLLWPFMNAKEEEEVLDYEDFDVLTLAADSDELEDEAPNKPKAKSKPSEKAEPHARIEQPMPELQSKPIEKPSMPELPPKPIDKPETPKPESLRTFRIPKFKSEELKAQPAVMHSVYLQEKQEPIKDKVTERSQKTPLPPAVADDVRRKREEASAARRTKETNPKFGPLFRSVPVGSGPDFGRADLAPLSDPLTNWNSLPQEPLHRPSRPASQYVPENFGLPISVRPVEPSSRIHSLEITQYVPENLVISSRDNRPAKVPAPMRTASYQGISSKHWITEVFGVKCLQYLDNRCSSVGCDHTMSSEGEVESRLFSMTEEALVHTYRLSLRSNCILGRYFKTFSDIFERRNLIQHLLQMLANCRLYRATAVPVVTYIFQALQRCGKDLEATSCIMADLWCPYMAHKYRDLTLLLLEILGATNWQDYIDEVIDLHKTHKFLLPDEYLVRIITWAESTRNDALQKKAMVMLLDDLNKYCRNPTLVALIARASKTSPPDTQTPNDIPQLDLPPIAGPGPSLNLISPGQQQYPGLSWNTNSNLAPQHDRQPEAGPAAGQQQQYLALNWKPIPSPSLVSQHDRLPGVGLGSSLIQPQQNTNSNLVPQHDRQPGAGPAAGQQQQYSALNWKPIPSSSLVSQHDRLPGVGLGSSVIQPQQYPVWTPSPLPQHDRLIGAGLVAGQPQQLNSTAYRYNPILVIQQDRLPAPGASPGQSLVHQQQQNPVPIWSSQANTLNRADDNQYRQYPQGLP